MAGGNHSLALRLLAGIARLGVREVCVAAGARNAPLVAPLLASEGVVVRHFFDERSAAFFALGRMMTDRRPVAILTTSGTAVGELLPAAMEAYYQGLPLALVTADRPAAYRGSGAPQAVEQMGIFGPYAAPTVDLDVVRMDGAWDLDGAGGKPIHINVCFDEPLLPVSEGIDFRAIQPAQEPNTGGMADDRLAAEIGRLQREGGIALVGGLHPADVADAKRLLLFASLPIVAEATSNLTDDPELAGMMRMGGERTLQSSHAKSVLRLGAVPSWRWWRDLESRPEVRVVNASRPGFPGLGRRENVVNFSWSAIEAWKSEVASGAGGLAVNAEEAARRLRLRELLSQYPLSEPAWMQHVRNAAGNGARIFLGNSLPVREYNLTLGSAKGTCVHFANRGANGIDGLLSTFFGVSAEAEESWAIVGDLSALYDLSAPWILRQLPAANRRIVVINNGGGKIFARVESLRSLDDAARAVIENRHALEFAHWARLWGMDYRLCEDPSNLTGCPPGAGVLEVRPDPLQTESFWRAWQDS